jgi:hypothetical protein
MRQGIVQARITSKLQLRSAALAGMISLGRGMAHSKRTGDSTTPSFLAQHRLIHEP